MDAWSYLIGTGDAWSRMHGTSGDAWNRLPGITNDAWARLIGPTGPIFKLTDILDRVSMIQLIIDEKS